MRIFSLVVASVLLTTIPCAAKTTPPASGPISDGHAREIREKDAEYPGVSDAPEAARVMARGQRKLESALRIALEPRKKSVLLIVDVTPYTAEAIDTISKALVSLDTQVTNTQGKNAQGKATTRWRIARLGDRPSSTVETPGALAPRLAGILRKDTRVRATIPALHKTVSMLQGSNATVIYLADWHFEDDVALERFIRKLRAKKHVFSVIGSEACFGRGWNDGFYPPDRGTRRNDQTLKMYADGVGRNPFGVEDAKTPWHGGDTAWTHIPTRWRATPWSTKFPALLKAPPSEEERRMRGRYGPTRKRNGKKNKRGTPEDLQERRKDAQDERALRQYWFPLSSSFGSYPLMRAAGMTGGRYVLWSWNPSGRSDVTYDYSRCNYFAPDLRSRRAIQHDIPRRAIAQALIQAWNDISNERVRVADISPPLDRSGRVPTDMVEINGENHLSTSFHSARELATFRIRIVRFLAAVKSALARLEPFVAQQGSTDAARRYHADAMLLRHTLLVKQFQLSEAFAASQGIPKNAWKNPKLIPVLDALLYLRSREKPELLMPEPVKVFDKGLAKAMLEHRRAHLRKYLGTPFGELVARNGIYTYRLDWRPIGGGSVPARESPSESTTPKRKTPPPAPPGSAPGGGPSTGGG